MPYGRLLRGILLILALALLVPVVTARRAEAQQQPVTTPASVTFQVNPAHDGNLDDPAIRPPLAQLWAVDLQGSVSYPLVVGDKVFVTVAPVEGPYGSKLYALDAATGDVAWGPVSLGGVYWWSGAAYDNGKVFALNGSALLRAYNASDGTPLWSTQLPEAFSVSSPPTALNGIVYVSSSGWEGGGLFAIDEMNGAILWRAAEAEMHDGPAVTDKVLYIGTECGKVRALNPRDGSVFWSRETGCSGSFGATTVYYNDKVYSRSISPANLVSVDARTGRKLQIFSASRMPVFTTSRAFFFADGNLQALNEATGRILWTFAGEGDLASNPLVVNGNLYIASGSSKKLYVLDPGTGSVMFTAPLPAEAETPDDWNGRRTIGMGAGNGRLLVPAASWLVAFGTDANVPNADGCQSFGETGKTVCGRFLQYWNTHGGLLQQGLPISDELQETSDTDGKTYTVQYFERAVFEHHPENQPPNDVLLSLLGVFRYNAKYKGNAPWQVANNSANRVLFTETGKWVGGKFLEYWQVHGGLAQQGLPISDEFLERSDLNGQNYMVQYFERAVFEYHPENPPPYDVLLSQLGTFRFRSNSEVPTVRPTAPSATPGTP